MYFRHIQLRGDPDPEHAAGAPQDPPGRAGGCGQREGGLGYLACCHHDSHPDKWHKMNGYSDKLREIQGCKGDAKTHEEG